MGKGGAKNGADIADFFLCVFKRAWRPISSPNPLTMPDAAALSRPGASTTVASFVRSIRTSPRAATIGCLWLLGLFLAFLAPAPVASECGGVWMEDCG